MRMDFVIQQILNPECVVMLGDSFTELGNLSDEELVSTKLGKLLGRPIKNLGVFNGFGEPNGVFT